MRHFTIVEAEQRSREWHLARLGRLTGSVAGDMLAKAQSGGYKAGRQNLKTRLVLERLTGCPQEDGYQSEAMRRGVEKEPNAVAAYEAHTGDLLQITGFLSHTVFLAGCSLDGHVGDFTGIVELKCPQSATHMKYLRDGKVPADYLPQIIHNLWVTGAEWADFVSFNDRFPPNLQLFVKRYQRIDVEVEKYAEQAVAFLHEVDDELAALKTMANLSDQLKAAVA